MGGAETAAAFGCDERQRAHALFRLLKGSNHGAVMAALAE
jgi:hypothetical protein